MNKDIILDREKIDSYLWSNYRKLKDPEFLFGVDNNQDSIEDFENADLRVLLIFLTPGKIRGFSSTVFTLDKLIHDGSKGEGNVFVDYMYFPYDRTVDKFVEDGIPLMFGNVSHASYTDYDLILTSVSIFPEVVNYPPMLEYSGISLNYKDRLDNEDIPPIILGGASSLTVFSLFGNTGRGGRSLVDLAYFGYGDGIVDVLSEESINFKKKFGSIKENKKEFIDYMKYKSEIREYCYHPISYKYNYDMNTLEVESIDKLDEKVPDKIQVMNKKNDFVDFSKRLFSMDGSGITRHNLRIARGCTGKGHCSFCQEGSIGGSYQEKCLDKLIEEMDEMKRYSATSSLGYYSYNTNYYSKFLDLMKESGERFKNLSLITMRADVLASREDYVELGKKLGLTKMAVAIEGMGDRIRNRILNKNLSKHQIRQAVRNIFKQKFSTLKINIIITGWETQEDIDEWLEELDMILEERKKIGVNTDIRITHTSLTIYDQTPLRWMPRETARLSWDEEKTMEGYMQELRGREVRFRFHGRGYKYFFEQLLLDIGELGTEILVGMSIDEGARYYTDYRNMTRDALIKYMDKVGINPEMIFRERNVDEIMPSDSVQFVPQKKIEVWKDMHEDQDFREGICLKTSANMNPECANCGFCDSKEDKSSNISRDITNESGIDDIMQVLSRQRFADAHRLVLKQSNKWSLYDRKSLSKYIISLFLRKSDYLLESYYDVGRNSLYWVSDRGQRGWAGGKWVFDVKWNQRVNIDKLEDLVEEVNEELTSAEILNIYPGAKEMPVKKKQKLSWFGYIEDCNLSKIKDNLLTFDWEVKSAKSVIGVEMAVEEEYIPDLKDNILYTSKENKVLIYMNLKMDVSPYLVMSSILNEPYKNILAKSKFNVMNHIEDIDANCECGNQLGLSLIDNQVQRECSICKGKKLLYHVGGRK